MNVLDCFLFIAPSQLNSSDIWWCLIYLIPSCTILVNEFRHVHKIHSHFTRQRDQLRLPLAKTTKYQDSFRINGARAYIRSARDLNTFKSSAKRHFKRQAISWIFLMSHVLRTFSVLLFV